MERRAASQAAWRSRQRAPAPSALASRPLITDTQAFALFAFPAYFVSFGPHGPRKATTQPGQGLRSAIGVLTIVGATFGLFFGLRNFGAWWKRRRRTMIGATMCGRRTCAAQPPDHRDVDPKLCMADARLFPCASAPCSTWTPEDNDNRVPGAGNREGQGREAEPNLRCV